MQLKEAILSQFEPDIVVPLIEFGESISHIKADAIMFMARKSLCLYDVLLSLGVPPTEKCVISDRVLDMRLDPLFGKRVALIDDTLILGTTLAKAKRTLEKANAKIKIHVFCVDQKWWCKDLLQPDHISLQLDDSRVMTFCAGEVRALSLVPRPYLVDFPLSLPIRIRIAEFSGLLSSVDWISARVSTELQGRNGICAFTFFPTDSVIQELISGLGADIVSCIEIIKVRAFSRRHEDIYWTQLVPTLTLKPIKESDLKKIFHYLLDSISAKSQDTCRT
ncbi:MAG: phosphoribosyltransferase [Pyrinomonadaceae bacterium]|nr:phosphoribosyltransferase [Pyrinomonadaceae bacterium]